MNRLDYSIPPFKTLVWVSDEAKINWENRFEKINEALIQTIFKSLTSGDLDHQYLIIEGWRYLKILALAAPLEISVLETFLGNKNAKGPIYYELLLQKKNSQTVNILSNCCLKKSVEIRKKNQKENVWEAALQTNLYSLEKQEISLGKDMSTSVFWQRILVTLGSQHKCSFDCKKNKQEQQKSIALLVKYGYKNESEWLANIYNWPVSWNASHGICELRTPILKLAFDTDATANSYTINVDGNIYPEDGAPGNRFPYKQRKFLRISDSKSFKAGLQHGS